MENHEPKGDTSYGAGLIAGRNPVAEALRSGRAIDCLYVAAGKREGQIPVLLAKAKKLGIPIKECDPRKLAHMTGGANCQGIVAVAAAVEYADLEDMLTLARERGEPPLLLVCDGLEDPHNLGAVIRSAECAGAHGVIIPRHRNVGLTWAVGKAIAYQYEGRLPPLAGPGKYILHPGVLHGGGRCRDALVVRAAGHI